MLCWFQVYNKLIHLYICIYIYISPYIYICMYICIYFQILSLKVYCKTLSLFPYVIQ